MLIDIINRAIEENKILIFDYVSANHEISYHRLVQPKELKEIGKNKILTLYGQDLRKGLMRSFQLEGIMKCKVMERGELKKEYEKNLI